MWWVALDLELDRCLILLFFVYDSITGYATLIVQNISWFIISYNGYDICHLNNNFWELQVYFEVCQNIINSLEMM
jgi:riboflavin transporter FmnP